MASLNKHLLSPFSLIDKLLFTPQHRASAHFAQVVDGSSISKPKDPSFFSWLHYFPAALTISPSSYAALLSYFSSSHPAISFSSSSPSFPLFSSPSLPSPSLSSCEVLFLLLSHQCWISQVWSVISLFLTRGILTERSYTILQLINRSND